MSQANKPETFPLHASTQPEAASWFVADWLAVTTAFTFPLFKSFADAKENKAVETVRIVAEAKISLIFFSDIFRH